LGKAVGGNHTTGGKAKTRVRKKKGNGRGKGRRVQLQVELMEDAGDGEPIN